MDIRPNIDRWSTLLKSSIQNRQPTRTIDLKKSLGQHRQWIVDCLGAIDLIRSGTPVSLDVEPAPIQIPQPASKGAQTANQVWTNYLLFVMGIPGSGEHLSDAIANLNPTALQSGINDNPEPWWANELLILHALQSYSFINRDSAQQAKLDACIEFHLAEIQPDHATNEPWAIHAFAAHCNGNITAETLLHAGMVHGAGELTPVAQLIVADALHALEAVSKNA